MQQVKLISADGELRFALCGEIDSASSEDLYTEVCAAYAQSNCNVTFDCAGLEFIDSTTLGTFVKIYKRLCADGYGLKLVNVPARIKKLFEICALDKLLEIG